jgi:cobyrinic acid a,c-diamide synthase
VVPFKKGPDYIDAAWLTRAAGQPCRNLDLFLMSPEVVTSSFSGSASGADVAVIEGNRGLFDGMDARGSYSTAELAKLLQTPVVLSVDCTKATRTVAAVVLGCQQLDTRVPLRGVILNQVAGPRHESVLREAIAGICNIPVLGAIPRIRERFFPERHLGLVPPEEHGQLESAIEQAMAVAERHLALHAIWDLAREAPPLEAQPKPGPTPGTEPHAAVARIVVLRDAAFQFYYPENLEALETHGAQLIRVSPISDAALPEVDALYIGGGFPETLAPLLSENKPFLGSLRRNIERGLPVYAECGGTVYLGEKLLFEGNEYPMVAALPAVFAFGVKPQGHGYTAVETVAPNPFYPVGQNLRGHEFHYTYLQSSAEGLDFAFRVQRGHGFDGQHDGLCHRNLLASYTHVHALGTPGWAPALVRAATRFRGASRPA